MSCTVLLAAFSGLLRGQLLRPDPIYWIDSLQDLYQWKELKIQAFGGTYIDTFAKDSKSSPMVKNFLSRLHLLNYYDFNENKKGTDIDYNGIPRNKIYHMQLQNFLTSSHNILSNKCILIFLL